MTNPAPYASDVKAKGWRFELDHERIRQSDTWALAPADVRPWLLMLWMTAWEQVPCGSLPSADELICARIGITTKVFTKSRVTLLRGWWLADDGRLYHPTLTERVLEMLTAKTKERDRKAAYRLRMDAGRPPLSHGTDAGQQGDSSGGDPGGDDTGTGTGTKLNTDSEAKASGGKPPMSADEIIFSYGLGMLTSSGIADKQARSFLGGLRKGHGDDVLINTLRECAKAKPLQPLEWLAAALPPEQRGAAKSRPAPLESFAEQDRKAGIKRWEEMTGRIHPENQKAADVIDITPRQERIA